MYSSYVKRWPHICAKGDGHARLVNPTLEHKGSDHMGVGVYERVVPVVERVVPVVLR